jgi:hypothetical protein
MARIFGGADCVILDHLGEEADNSDLIIQTIRQIPAAWSEEPWPKELPPTSPQ